MRNGRQYTRFSLFWILICEFDGTLWWYRCSDGSAVLAVGDDHTTRVYHTFVFTPICRHVNPLADTSPYEIRPELSSPSSSSSNPSSVLKPTQTHPHPAPIHSSLWYPSASLHSLPSFCYVSAVGDGPVRLVDGGDGRVSGSSFPDIDSASGGEDEGWQKRADLCYFCGVDVGLSQQIRATYPIIDHNERFVAPYSMTFNYDASR